MRDTTGTFKIKKNTEAFRCRAAIQSQLNGLVTHSIEVSIRIAFNLSKKDVHPLFLDPFPFLPFFGIESPFSHSGTRTTIDNKDLASYRSHQELSICIFPFLKNVLGDEVGNVFLKAKLSNLTDEIKPPRKKYFNAI